MKKVFLSTILAGIMLPAFAMADADINDNQQKEEFASDETIETGILYDMANMVIEAQAKGDQLEYGRKVTKYASVPKFGGYFIGKYGYNSDENMNKTEGFQQRLARAYVDGTILKDFNYRIQVQFNNAGFHMKDYFVEWAHFKEFKVKFGQYKRAFGFENPMNPWDVGVGDYSQMTKKLTGHSDFIGVEASSNGGRDQGVQIQGDLVPVGKDKHRLIHYQLMVANGQGINAKDANSNKDVIGTLQVQPVKGLFIGAFGWLGKYTGNGVTVDRKRWIAGVKYDANDWTVRAEYGYSTGYQIKSGENGYYAGGSNHADAWYATVGIPCTNWLKTYIKYDVYRENTRAKMDGACSIYSVAPNFQLHKNLLFQLQYNYVNNKLKDKKYSELWAEIYVRF